MILRFVIIFFFSFCNLFLLIRPINNFEEEIDDGHSALDLGAVYMEGGSRKILEGGITLRWVYMQKFRPVSCPSREG